MIRAKHAIIWTALALAGLGPPMAVLAADGPASDAAQECSRQLRDAIGDQIVISDNLPQQVDAAQLTSGQLNLTAIDPVIDRVVAQAVCTYDGRGHTWLTVTREPMPAAGTLSAQ